MTISPSSRHITMASGAASRKRPEFLLGLLQHLRLLPQFVGLFLQLGVAAAEFHKYRHFGAQHFRHDGLEQEIHRARDRNLETDALRSGIRSGKESGIWRDRGRLRISSAVSKPSISGIRTSSRIAAKSSFRTWWSASFPEFASTNSSPKPLSAASRETRFSGVSSTSRIFILPFHGGILIGSQPAGGRRHKIVLSSRDRHGCRRRVHGREPARPAAPRTVGPGRRAW